MRRLRAPQGRHTLALTAAFLICAGVSLGAEEPALQPPDVVVLDVVGEVDFQRAPKGEWVVAERGMRFGQAARIVTGQGAEVLLACGSTCLVWVGENSMIQVRSIRHQDSELDLEFLVDPGTARLLVRTLPDLATHAILERPRLTATVGRGRPDVVGPVREPEPPPPPQPILPIVLDCTKGDDDASHEFARNAFRSLVDGWDSKTEEAGGEAYRRAEILMDQVILLEAGYPDLAAHLGWEAQGGQEPSGFFARVDWGVLSCCEEAGEVREALARLLKASPQGKSLRGE